MNSILILNIYMLNVLITRLLCISMLSMASLDDLFAHIVNFYANIKKTTDKSCTTARRAGLC